MMKSYLLLCIIPVACLSGCASVPATAPPKKDALGIDLQYQKETLSNGLTVILVEDKTTPVVSYQSWYRVGSVDEKPGLTGLAHLFEHLMFKGTPKYGAKQFFLQLEAKGAEVNAYTTRDFTVYHETFTPQLLEKVIDMESDRMTHLALDDATVLTEKQVVLEERKLRTDNSPEGRIQEALWKLAYTQHPYQWPTIGSVMDVMTAPLEQVRAFYHHYYVPANATVVIVGNIDKKATFELIKKYYGRIEKSPVPTRDIQAEPEQNEERRLILRDHVAGLRFAQGYHVTAADNDDSYALDVLSNILFEGSSSRAHRRMVDEKELVLGVDGSAYTPTYPGLFIMTAAMKEGVPVETAEAELWSLIKEIQDKGVTDEEIRVAVRQLTVQMVDGVRTPHGLGTLIGTVTVTLGDTARFTQDLAKYLKVTRADVVRVAQKYLYPNNRSVVILAPELSKDKNP